MEAMRAVVLVTCVISILSGVLDALKPNARFDRQLRLLLSAVFVLGILTPLSQGAAAFQPDWEPDTETAAVELEAPPHRQSKNRRRRIWKNRWRQCCGSTALPMHRQKRRCISPGTTA